MLGFFLKLTMNILFFLFIETFSKAPLSLEDVIYIYISSKRTIFCHFEYLRDPDASSMRAELIRYILYFTVKDMNLIVESRVHLINLLLVSAAVRIL